MSEQRYRTVAYVRVSTTDQTTSLDSQIRHFNEVMDTTPHLVNLNSIKNQPFINKKCFR